MSSSRKEWRVVSDHQSVPNARGEVIKQDLESSKLGQLDERTIYEVQQGEDSLDIDFCSLATEEDSGHDVLQQRLHSVVRQREDLQDMEIEIKAEVIARSQIMEMRRSYGSQIRDHAASSVKLQEQLHERDHAIRELEMKVDEKERELRDNQLANEVAWAKEDLLREQNKELATFRRERDSTQAERGQHVKQIQELKERIEEKERELMELREQNRIGQETILFKDEQLREAQSWISRVQEMDALQSTTNHSLQAELRERTEQYNQLWLSCQRQFAELERAHVHAVQRLQLELAELRGEKSHTLPATMKSENDGSEIELTVPNSSNGAPVMGDSAAPAPHHMAGSHDGNGHAEVSSCRDGGLLDERSLLACIVRTCGRGRDIRLSSTLPNRLARMLAPLHWHDYRPTYGNLDDFVAAHPDLFLIEGDFICLRDGAQAAVIAAAAAAKAATASLPLSSSLPSVAVTPYPVRATHDNIK